MANFAFLFIVVFLCFIGIQCQQYSVNIFLTPYPEKLQVVRLSDSTTMHVFKTSTGRPGFATTTGSYYVMAKNDTAMSSIYHSPSMSYTNLKHYFFWDYKLQTTLLVCCLIAILCYFTLFCYFNSQAKFIGNILIIICTCSLFNQE